MIRALSRGIQIAAVAVGVMIALSVPACAQEGEFVPDFYLSGAIGAAITIVGASWGIGRIGASAVEGMARQPEVAGQIQTAMIIAAALIEGVTFFALIVCIIQGAPWPT